ncbi:hypothetical protein [Leisingera sp. ANG59]|uniref:hypothetical protein n=1 Tax=Leisingera sp. ANG59 TaxID=2675221 RepID=UPI001573ED0E|nr:hypothetical protein [Leisingera sp. ANG59]
MPILSDLIGGGGAVELGTSYASGTASATIVTAAANTSGVLISTACLRAEWAITSSETFTVSLTVDGNTILEAVSRRDNGFSSAAISGVMVPAGKEIAVNVSNAAAKYFITYEVQ